MGLLASETFTIASRPELVVVPLFILMGNVASATGMSRQLYEAAHALIGSIRGGLASATVIGCGGFAALSGSSVAPDQDVEAGPMSCVNLLRLMSVAYAEELARAPTPATGERRVPKPEIR